MQVKIIFYLLKTTTIIVTDVKVPTLIGVNTLSWLGSLRVPVTPRAMLATPAKQVKG